MILDPITGEYWLPPYQLDDLMAFQPMGSASDPFGHQCPLFNVEATRKNFNYCKFALISQF